MKTFLHFFLAKSKNKQPNWQHQSNCILNMTMSSSQNHPNQPTPDILHCCPLLPTYMRAKWCNQLDPLLPQGQALVIQTASICLWLNLLWHFYTVLWSKTSMALSLPKIGIFQQSLITQQAEIIFYYSICLTNP